MSSLRDWRLLAEARSVFGKGSDKETLTPIVRIDRRRNIAAFLTIIAMAACVSWLGSRGIARRGSGETMFVVGLLGVVVLSITLVSMLRSLPKTIVDGSAGIIRVRTSRSKSHTIQVDNPASVEVKVVSGEQPHPRMDGALVVQISCDGQVREFPFGHYRVYDGWENQLATWKELQRPS